MGDEVVAFALPDGVARATMKPAAAPAAAK
jgi:hypothetical protein